MTKCLIFKCSNGFWRRVTVLYIISCKCLLYTFHEGFQIILQNQSQIFWYLRSDLQRCFKALNPELRNLYPMKNIVFVQEDQTLQNLKANKLFVSIIFNDCRDS